MVTYNRLSVFRAEQGMSRKELAEAVGVNPQTIGYLERGDYAPSVELALKLAAVFATPVEALFSLEPFPPLARAIAKQGES
ncbi:MAG: helix-turn-helix transcriptional regulator [Hyphomonadaceae bacterium]|nr:helix-turn-helix transcriptional regulator [Hyphomonadaceae bacterium]